MPAALARRLVFVSAAVTSCAACLLVESFGPLRDSVHDAAPSVDVPDGGAAADADADAGDGVLTTFTGTPGSVVAFNGYVYFTADAEVWACSATQGCAHPTSIFHFQNTQPRSITRVGNQLAWSDGPAAKLTFCFASGATACNTTSSLEDQRGIGAVVAGATGLELFYLLDADAGGGTTELRRYAVGENSLDTIAFLPARSADQAVHAADGVTLVALGGTPYSVYRPSDSDAAVVAPLGGALAIGRGPSAIGIAMPPMEDAAAPARAIWIRNTEGRGELYECLLTIGAPSPCAPSAAARFVEGGSEVTALVTHDNQIAWAQADGEGSAIFACGTIPCPKPRLLKRGIGRVSAMAAAQGGSLQTLFFIASTDGRTHTLGRADLP